MSKKYFPDNYFIDYENVGAAGLKGIENLGKECMVTVFYTEKAQSITFDILDLLRNSSACVVFNKVHVGTKNALDFQLASQLGFTISENLKHFKNAGHRYFIISHDNGYNALLNYWSSRYITDITIGLYADLTLEVTAAEYNARFSEMVKAECNDLTTQNSTADISSEEVMYTPKLTQSETLKEIRKIITDSDKSNRICITLFSGKTLPEIYTYICTKIYSDEKEGLKAIGKIKHLL